MLGSTADFAPYVCVHLNVYAPLLVCAGVEDVDTAMQAARKAFDEGPWTRMGGKVSELTSQVGPHKPVEVDLAQVLVPVGRREAHPPLCKRYTHTLAHRSWPSGSPAKAHGILLTHQQNAQPKTSHPAHTDTQYTPFHTPPFTPFFKRLSKGSLPPDAPPG